jgi:hypothetical protein
MPSIVGAAVLAVSCGGGPVSSGATPPGTTSSAVPVPKFTLRGYVDGIAWAGITVTLTGPVTSQAITDANGNYAFEGLPSGGYVLTPSSDSGITFTPPAYVFTKDLVTDPKPDVLKIFDALPHSVPFTETIAGDAESGVPTGTYTKTPVPETGPFEADTETNPDVIIYLPGNNLSVFSFRHYDAFPFMGGWVQFSGPPTVGSYSKVPTASFQQVGAICWQENPSTVPGSTGGSAFWLGDDFTLAFDSVTEFPTNVPDWTFYSVHGTFHLDCPPYVATPDDPFNGYARGNVTVDIKF